MADKCEKHDAKFIWLYNYEPSNGDTQIITKEFGCCACRTEKLREQFNG